VTWLRSYTAADGAAATLVCLPHAGGAASAFVSWRAKLPGAWNLFAATYPGRENRWGEPPAADLGAMAQAIAAEVAEMAGAGPVVLFGHSMGARVAYEIAVARQRAGERTALLAVSGAGPEPGASTLTARVTADPRTGDELARQIIALDPDSAPALGHPELRGYVLQVMSDDLDLLARHAPSGVVLDGVPVLALGGDADAVLIPPQARAGGRSRHPQGPAEALAAWAGLTTGPFEQLVLPGGHFYLRDHEDAVIAAVVRAARSVRALHENPVDLA
jgi:pyochelin biosynthetic protein PchC